MGKVNWLAIIVSVIVSMFIGFMFYGALFQDLWMSGNGITLDSDNNMFRYGEPMTGGPTFPMIMNFLAMLVYALIMNWLINKTNSTSLVKGAILGALIGLMMFIGVFTGNLFAGNPTSLTLIDGTYSLVLFTVIGLILGAWRKK